MTRPVPQIAVDFLRQAEGVRLHAYRDSGGIWTIGVGHVGPEVTAGIVISQAQVDAYLFADATKAAVRLAQKVRADVLNGLSEHQYAALVSFVFNLGAGDWTIWKVLNAGKLDCVPVQMMRFVNAGGRKIEGLVHRRSAEVALWTMPDVAGAAVIAQAAPEPPPPSSETRVAVTPPTPMPQKPLAKSKSFVASGITAVLAAATPFADQAKGVLKSVSDTLEPYVGSSDVIQHLHGNLTIALAAVAVVSTLLLALKNRSSQ